MKNIINNLLEEQDFRIYDFELAEKMCMDYSNYDEKPFCDYNDDCKNCIKEINKDGLCHKGIICTMDYSDNKIKEDISRFIEDVIDVYYNEISKHEEYEESIKILVDDIFSGIQWATHFSEFEKDYGVQFNKLISVIYVEYFDVNIKWYKENDDRFSGLDIILDLKKSNAKTFKKLKKELYYRFFINSTFL